MADAGRSTFTNSREVILPVTGHWTGFYFSESERIGRIYETAAEAWADHRDDAVVKFIRFDMDDMRGTDVTEEMAEAMLAESDLTPEDEDLLPTFVRTSEAWEDYCETYHVANGGYSQRTHGTLNHAQQGI